MLNQPQGFQPGLGQSNTNNFYTSGIAASQLNGTGSQVQANKLNLSRNATGVSVVPGPVQYIEQPVEVIKKVKKQVFAPSVAPSVQLNQLDPILRNLIAETHAKVALLIMENNRIKWRIAQRDAEIQRLRIQGPSSQVIRTSHTALPVTTHHQVTSLPVIRQSQTTLPQVVRTSGTIGSTIVNRGPVTTTLPVTSTIQQPGQVVHRHYESTTSTTVGGAPGLPVTTTMTQGGLPINTTVRPGGAVVTGAPIGAPIGAPTQVIGGQPR